MLMSYPPDWTVKLAYFAAQSDCDGIAAMRSAIRELEAVGLARLERPRGEDGRMQGSRWIIYEVAELNPNRESGNPTLGSPETRSHRASANNGVTNTESKSNTEPTNTENKENRERGARRGKVEEDGSPSMDDVQAVFDELGHPEQARKFYNYYAAVGWKRKGDPIVDVRPCAEMWVDRKKDFRRGKAKGAGQPLTQHEALESLKKERIQLSPGRNFDYYFEPVGKRPDGKALFVRRGTS